MARTEYDSVALFNPEGKLVPLANIDKSIELGAITISLINENTNEGIILAHKLIEDHSTKKKNNEEEEQTTIPPYSTLIYPQKKIFKISDKTLYSFSGITNDGLDIMSYILNMSINERVNKDRNIDAVKVLDKISHSAGLRIMCRTSRPFGCGIVLVNINSNKKIQLVEMTTGGKLFCCRATSIGNRAQGARSILERDYGNNMTFDQMAELGIRAMKNATSGLKAEHVDIWGINGEGVFEVDPKNYF